MHSASISCTLKLTTMVNGGQNALQLRRQVLNLYKTVRIFFSMLFRFQPILIFVYCHLLILVDTIKQNQIDI